MIIKCYVENLVMMKKYPFVAIWLFIVNNENKSTKLFLSMNFNNTTRVKIVPFEWPACVSCYFDQYQFSFLYFCLLYVLIYEMSIHFGFSKVMCSLFKNIKQCTTHITMMAGLLLFPNISKYQILIPYQSLYTPIRFDLNLIYHSLICWAALSKLMDMKGTVIFAIWGKINSQFSQ